MNPRTRRISRRSIVCLIAAIFARSSPVGAFTSILNADSRLVDGRQQRYYGRIITHNNHNWRCRHASPRLPPLRAIAETATKLADYAPAAASLFNNMKLPAAVVTAGMISLGFATGFPKLPKDSLEKVYSQELRARCSKLERLHIVLGLISVTSMLIVVLWSAVEVNQLTERSFTPAYSVWDLINNDCDLAWSAVNSHYMMGIIGFTGMLWLRAYVMLLVTNASKSLMYAASTGTAAALCLMVSIVNRGVESGGGDDGSYGSTILDLFSHYASLLLKAATDGYSPGPLQLSAILLETASLCFMFMVLLTETDTSFEQKLDEDSCSIDAYDVLNDDDEVAKLSAKEVEKLKTCVGLEEDQRRKEEVGVPTMINGWTMEEEEEKQQALNDSGDSFCA